MGKKNFYGVRSGFQTGVFYTWAECQAVVKGYKGAEYKGFATKQEALAWLNDEDGVVPDFAGSPGDEPANESSNESSHESANGSSRESANESSREPAKEAVFDYAVYTDGSYKDGRYSYGYVFVKTGEVIYESNGVGENQEAAALRNVAGEMTAVMRAVKKAEDLQVKILIYHDYSGIAHWVSGKWKAQNPFTRAYADFMRARHGRYAFKKVTGHSGNKYNDHADRLAKEALGIV